MICINNLAKYYDKEKCLENININIEEKGLYIFTGVNGSGKSTILKLISKIIFKSSGEIKTLANISYLPDKFSFPNLMRVKNYLKSIFKLYKMKLDVKRIMHEYQIPDKRIKDLSKGNLQKLGILQILINDCQCYVFDEPLDGLDDFSKKLFKKKIIEKINDNKIILMSLHNKTYFNDLSPKIFEVKEKQVYEKQKKI